jgi:uncharacterized protein (TIGR02246 family)
LNIGANRTQRIVISAKVLTGLCARAGADSMLQIIAGRPMRRLVHAIFLAGIASVSMPWGAAACQPPAPNEISSLVDRWNTAAATGHPDKITRLYANDATLMPANGAAPRIGYQPIRDHYVHTLQAQPQLEVISRTVRADCDMAVDRGVLILSTGPKDAREAIRHSFTFVYVRHGDTWQIEHHHVSPLQGPPETLRTSRPARVPAVAGFVFRAPGKPKSQSRPRPAASSPAEVDTYRTGTWDQGIPHFEE